MTRTRDQFDLTPRQYHANLDKLWVALGVTGPQDIDVFTQAARAIVAGREATRILRCQYVRGNLDRVVLYPCHCGRLACTEWYLKGENYHRESVVEVADLHEARAIYQPIFGTLRESHYVPSDDSYTSECEWDNFIVTGSHCACHNHQREANEHHQVVSIS